MYVMTIDQTGSRGGPDRIPLLLDLLADIPTIAGFDRTVGDEAQALLAEPTAVRTALLRLLRDGGWHTGVGVGSVETDSWTDGVASGRGPAFYAAREAVEEAKRRPVSLAVRTGAGARGGDAARAVALAADLTAVWTLLGLLVERRTAAQWRVLDAAADGADGVEVARALGISPQAVSTARRRAGATAEADILPLLDRLLAELDGASDGSVDTAADARGGTR